jgi:tetratricopeptide (TPR) repeat protein
MIRLASLGLLLVVAAVGCKRNLEQKPVLPALDGMEPAVVQKISELHAQVAADLKPETLARYARALHAHGLLEEAERVYLVAAENTEMPEKFSLVYLAAFSASRRAPEHALALFEKARGLREDYAPLHVRMGRIQEGRQNWDEARRHYERAEVLEAKKKARSNGALAGLGRIELAEGRVPEAIALLESARALDPEDSQVHALLGAAYRRAGRAAEAAHAVRAADDATNASGLQDPIVSAMQREGVSSLVIRQMGEAAMKAGKTQEALAAFERALDARPDDRGALILKAQALVVLGRVAEAEPILDKLLAARSDDVSVLALQASCALSRNDLPTALVRLARAHAIDPRDAGVRHSLGRVLRASGRAAEASAHFRAFLDVKPHRNDVRVELASALAEGGRMTEALAEVDLVLAQDRDHAEARKLQARLKR